MLSIPAVAGAAPGAPQTGNSSVDEALNGILDTIVGGKQAGPNGKPTSQLLVVTAKNASATTGSLTGYEREANGQWKVAIQSTTAYLGAKGQGKAQDNVARTPSGTFGLDQAFGRKANPGTKMPYKQVTSKDWWDSDMKSPTYNTLVHKDGKPSADAENLYNMGPVYDYAVNIAHNPERKPGDASAIFLHVTNGSPTEGCVGIGEKQMVEVLKWLDPAKSPKITIGVNAQAPTGDGAGGSPQEMRDSPNGAAGGILGGLADSALNLIPSILGKVAQS
ncbi:MAG: L,D-transpeptidase family protein [Gordonia sp. (in: high G+C Gram-positive bacteria)]|uniref:L,D-transpeptidase family protein n=1 Tax=Gordonia sp. (in: high G+C Gram-positive bacteria) TaxID=84139 RepID=UPI0039E5BF71